MLFAVLSVAFGIATVGEWGTEESTETIGDLPPIYVITLILVPVCALLAGACWWLLVDSFRRGENGE